MWMHEKWTLIALWIMSHSLTNFTLRPLIWGGPSMKAIKPWAQKTMIDLIYQKKSLMIGSKW
jgi:hypothetical protein